MAGTFGADPQVAGQMSTELGQIRSAMKSMDRLIDGDGAATGSTRVVDALRHFFSESSDNREKMDGLLERASGLLGGLAEGTTSVDTALRDSLEAKDDAPAGGDPVPNAQRAV